MTKSFLKDASFEMEAQVIAAAGQVIFEAAGGQFVAVVVPYQMNDFNC